MSKNKLTTIVIILLCFAISPVVGQKKQNSKRSAPRPKIYNDVPTIRVERTPLEDANSAAPIVVDITSDNFQLISEKKVESSKIGDEIAKRIAAKFAEERIIYIKGGGNVEYGKAIEVMKLGRKAEADNYGLTVSESDEIGDLIANSVKVQIPLDIFSQNQTDMEPNPLALILTLRLNGEMALNNKTHTSEILKAKLQQIFRQRRQKGIFVKGSKNKIEKTVFIVAPLSIKFANVVKVAELLKDSGAYPIGLQVDELPQ